MKASALHGGMIEHHPLNCATRVPNRARVARLLAIDLLRRWRDFVPLEKPALRQRWCEHSPAFACRDRAVGATIPPSGWSRGDGAHLPPGFILMLLRATPDKSSRLFSHGAAGADCEIAKARNLVIVGEPAFNCKTRRATVTTAFSGQCHRNVSRQRAAAHSQII